MHTKHALSILIRNEGISFISICAKALLYRCWVKQGQTNRSNEGHCFIFIEEKFAVNHVSP